MVRPWYPWDGMKVLEGLVASGNVVGLGVDMVDIDQIEAVIARHGLRFIERVFTEREAAYCSAKRRPGQHFSVRFAAKEAAFKALGTGWAGGVTWHDVEVCVDRWGDAPTLRFDGEFATRMRVRTVVGGHVSLSHSRAMAVAVVALVGAV